MAKKRGQITPGMGRSLRKIREDKGLTREFAAEKAGIVARYLASIESEQKNPSVDTLYRLIRAYGVPPTVSFTLNWRKGTALLN